MPPRRWCAPTAPLPRPPCSASAERPPSAGPATRRSRHCSIATVGTSWAQCRPARGRSRGGLAVVSGRAAALLIAGAQGLRAIGRPRRACGRRSAVRRRGPDCSLAVFADVRRAAGDATDRWLYDTRLLMQEAGGASDIRSAPAALTPSPGTGGAGPEAEIVPGDSGGDGVAPRHWRVYARRCGGAAGAGRWIELRARPGEAGTVAGCRLWWARDLGP